MSVAEERPAVVVEEEVRRCPRCGAELRAGQEWCLECGADVGTRIVGTRSWRGPVALIGLLLAVAAAALVLALVELAGDAEQVTEQAPAAAAPPPAPAPAPTVAPAPAPAPSAVPTADPGGATPPATGEPSGELATWPAGQEAWTIVLEASATEEAARTRAEELEGLGVTVGLLNSDEYGSLEPGRFVVFSGQYDSRRAADQALAGLSDQAQGAYVRLVAP